MPTRDGGRVEIGELRVQGVGTSFRILLESDLTGVGQQACLSRAFGLIHSKLYPPRASMGLTKDFSLAAEGYLAAA